MKNAWKVNIWGVRGSLPVSGSDFMTYGGNTSCISVDCGKQLVVFDAGSGLISLGRHLRHTGRSGLHILISHLHMDHCLGLFGFPLFHDPHAVIHLYGSAHEGISFQKALETLLGPPYWPIGLKDFAAHVEVHEIIPGAAFRLAGSDDLSEKLNLRTLSGNHPNQSLLYRLESNDRSVIYALDCEMNEAIRHSLTDFSKGGSLLIWDANFTEEDLARHRGWGHSTWTEGIALRRSAGVGTVLMTHYASDYTDEFLQTQELSCTRTDPAALFAREGMRIDV